MEWSKDSSGMKRAVQESQLECFNKTPNEVVAWEDAVLVPVHTFTTTNIAEALSGASSVCGEMIFATAELYYQTCSHECWNRECLQYGEIPETHLEISNSSNTSRIAKGKQSLIHSSYQSETKSYFLLFFGYFIYLTS